MVFLRKVSLTTRRNFWNVCVSTGTADYFSLNQYTVNLVKYQEQPLQPVRYLNDVDAQAVDADPHWKR